MRRIGGRGRGGKPERSLPGCAGADFVLPHQPFLKKAKPSNLVYKVSSERGETQVCPFRELDTEEPYAASVPSDLPPTLSSHPRSLVYMYRSLPRRAQQHTMGGMWAMPMPSSDETIFDHADAPRGMKCAMCCICACMDTTKVGYTSSTPVPCTRTPAHERGHLPSTHEHVHMCNPTANAWRTPSPPRTAPPRHSTTDHEAAYYLPNRPIVSPSKVRRRGDLVQRNDRQH